ncbi:hypothetical protein PI125_g2938 [Phytophthora idaei]|nr:hypothetical protein PI125_g2938 [Phytophthora idaei]
MSSRPVGSEARGLNDDKLEEAAAYVTSIPNHHARFKIRHQASNT